MSSDRQQPESILASFKRPIWAVWAALALIGGYDLWTRHERHVLEILPYLLLLACPLMHVLMHRGHGHGGAGHHGGATDAQPEKERG